MKVILWVNDLSNKLLGRVYNIETFNKNVAKMRCKKEIMDIAKTLKEKDDNTVIFKIVGRYFCIIEIHFEESLRKMVFIDFQKRDDIAMGMFAATNKPTDKNIKQLEASYFRAYGYYKELYDSHYNDVELQIDSVALN
ncbi:MAG: hypothetical protein JST87_01575 [Bacteroidetes bacterium]|nr:hypothetical protein [Bacteroidota bacterium]